MEDAQQRFFERVELAGEGELDKIRGLLEEALGRRMQVRSLSVSRTAADSFDLSPSSNRLDPLALLPR